MCTNAEERGEHVSCCAAPAARTEAAAPCTMATPVCWMTAWNRFRSTSLMLFLFPIRCGDLGWSRRAAGGSREAGGMLCAASSAGLDIAAVGNTGQGGD